jgi:hypothetical protein
VIMSVKILLMIFNVALQHMPVLEAACSMCAEMRLLFNFMSSK